MICYKDRSWCANPRAVEIGCGRAMTPQVEADAEKWWGGPGAPFSMFDCGDCCNCIPIEQAVADYRPGPFTHIEEPAR